MSDITLIQVLCIWFGASVALAIVWAVFGPRYEQRKPVDSEDFHSFSYQKRLVFSAAFY